MYLSCCHVVVNDVGTEGFRSGWRFGRGGSFSLMVRAVRGLDEEYGDEHRESSPSSSQMRGK